MILLSLYFYFNPSHFDFFPSCPFYKFTGYYCPGCGSQRAIHDLIHLNVLDAIGHNVLMITTLVFGLGLYVFNKKKYLELVYHPKSPIIIFLIVILFWILRNIPMKPFSLLAP